MTVPVAASVQRPVLLAASSASRPTAKVDQKSPEFPGAEDLLTYNTHGGAFSSWILLSRSRQKARNLPAFALLKQCCMRIRVSGAAVNLYQKKAILLFCRISNNVEPVTAFRSGTAAPSSPRPPSVGLTSKERPC